MFCRRRWLGSGAIEPIQNESAQWLRVRILGVPSRSLEAASPEKHPLIDEFLPEHDFGATYEIGIQAPASVVYQRLLVCDFNAVWIARALMTLRSGRRIRPNRVPGDLRQRLRGTGFVILAEIPNELVIGVAGRFWRPDGGRCLNLSAGDFAGFSRAGYAKVVWNFRLRAATPESTVLSTETRIKCFGRMARWKFRLYWAVVGPFSGLIRKAILKQVKGESEKLALGGTSL